MVSQTIWITMMMEMEYLMKAFLRVEWVMGRNEMPQYLLIYTFPQSFPRLKYSQVRSSQSGQANGWRKAVDIWHLPLRLHISADCCYYSIVTSCNNAGELGEKDLSCSDFEYVLHRSYHYLRNFICLKSNK